MSIVKRIAIGAAALVVHAAALAQASPAGLWKTIDDDTKQEKSLVRLTDTGACEAWPNPCKKSPGLE